MSEDLELQISKLKIENENLKKQMANNSQGINGLLAELESYKQSLSESIQNGLNIRANLILLKKLNEELAVQLKEMKQSIELAA